MKKSCLALIISGLIIFSQCKDEQHIENWAAAVAGTYVGTAFRNGQGHPATTRFIANGDKMLNILLMVDSDSYCLDSVTMNSKSFFSILNSHDECTNLTEEAYGNFNGDSVKYDWYSGDVIIIEGVR